VKPQVVFGIYIDLVLIHQIERDELYEKRVMNEMIQVLWIMTATRKSYLAMASQAPVEG
jgi:hypothetical protein